MKFSTFKTKDSRRPFTEMQLSDFASIVHEPELGGAVFIEGARLAEQIRATKDHNVQKQLKQFLPAISPGTLFGQDRQDIRSYTGLMQIDIDEGISDPEQLRNDLGGLSWVAFSSLSVRKGVWLLIRIPEPENQPLYWEKINGWLLDKHGLTADPSRKNPKDLRFFAPDRDAIYNPNSKMLPFIPAEELPPKQPSYNRTCKVTQMGEFVSPFDDFNCNADVLSMLISDGWKINHRMGNKVRLTRPGKRSGTSADWDEKLRRLYVFTSTSNLAHDSNRHALSPVDIFMRLENITTTHQARQKLVEMGYGKK